MTLTPSIHLISEVGTKRNQLQKKFDLAWQSAVNRLAMRGIEVRRQGQI
jgi:hypothetical protein